MPPLRPIHRLIPLHARPFLYSSPPHRPLHRPLSSHHHPTLPPTSNHIRIIEVSPRDGLQTEKLSIPLATKIELIRRLARTGVRGIEAGAFVAPKWVPQMADSAHVLNEILGHPPAAPHPIAYNFLVPNLKGLEKFLQASKSANSRTVSSKENSPPIAPVSPNPNDANPKPESPPNQPKTYNSNSDSASDSTNPPPPQFTTEISFITAATEAFSQANTNTSIAQSLATLPSLITLAKSHNIRVRGYVSVALGCPYEGPNTPPQKVAAITRTLLEHGVDEVSIADTTGMGTAPRTRDLLQALSAAGIANQDLALHFHDTYGQALVNTMVGLEYGIRTFDSSVGGLGGCPYAKGATGNVATEDLVYCLHGLGMRTGVDVEEMARVGAWISTEMARENASRVGKAVMARLKESDGSSVGG